MKETGILFTAPMVKAILNGQKTQTRRIIKPVRGWEEKYPTCKPDGMADPWCVWWHGDITDRVGVSQDCPYGKPGDQLWVREAWRTGNKLNALSGFGIAGQAEEAGYKPGCPIRYEADQCIRKWGDDDEENFGPWGRYRHSRFMPRWASRLTLDVSDVRVERLNDISEADAIAEGCKVIQREGRSPCYVFDGTDYDKSGLCHSSAAMAYSILWDQINGEDSWGKNPWVWVVSFKRVEALERAA